MRPTSCQFHTLGLCAPSRSTIYLLLSLTKSDFPFNSKKKSVDSEESRLISLCSQCSRTESRLSFVESFLETKSKPEPRDAFHIRKSFANKIETKAILHDLDTIHFLSSLAEILSLSNRFESRKICQFHYTNYVHN